MSSIADEIFEEARINLNVVSQISRWCLVLSSIVAVGIVLMFKYAHSIESFAHIMMAATNSGKSESWEQLGLLLSLVFGVAGSRKLVEDKVVPKLFYRATGRFMYPIRSLNGRRLSMAEVAVLDPVLRRARRGHWLVKISINESDTAHWTYKYNLAISTALVLLGCIVLSILVGIFIGKPS